MASQSSDGEQRETERDRRLLLNELEDAVARLSAVRTTIRKSADEARRDLHEVMSLYMSQLRAREQQLLGLIDEHTSETERVMSSRLAYLHQAIGAMEHSIGNDGSSKTASVAQLPPSLPLVADVDAQLPSPIRLVTDLHAMRTAVATFCQLTVTDNAKAFGKIGTSLPGNGVIESDWTTVPLTENVLHAHKSLHVTQTKRSVAARKPTNADLDESVGQWLTAEARAELLQQLERTRRDSSISSTSSFDLVGQEEHPTETRRPTDGGGANIGEKQSGSAAPAIEHIRELMVSPTARWLAGTSAPATPTTSSPRSTLKRRRRHSAVLDDKWISSRTLPAPDARSTIEQLRSGCNLVWLAPHHMTSGRLLAEGIEKQCKLESEDEGRVSPDDGRH